MEHDEQNINWTTWLLGSLALALLAGGIYFWNGNKILTRQTERSERRADSLLSVRLQQETDMRQVESQLATAKEDNTELVDRVTVINRQLSQTDVRLRELRRDKARRGLTIGELNRNLTYLTTQRDSLGNQMTAMRDKIGWLTDSNTVYRERNGQLGGEVTRLNSTLLTMVHRATLTGDGFRVEAVKANQKETAKAKKVETLTVSFNVPADLGLTGEQEVLLSLTDAARNPVLTPLRTETVNLSTLNEQIPVHAVQTVAFGSAQQRITFRLTPGTPLKPGLYRAAVYTKNHYLGAVEFRFRDSFWFF